MELIPAAAGSTSDIPEAHTELIQASADVANTSAVVQHAEPVQVPRRRKFFKIIYNNHRD